MATDSFNSAGQLAQLEHDPQNHAKRVDVYVWNATTGAWTRNDNAIADGVDNSIKATVKQLTNQITTSDNGLVTNTIIHGKTTGGGGGYVDVKVNPSGALVTDSTISGNVSTESAIYDKRLDDTTTAGYIYIGEATVGTATSGSTWRIKRLDTSSGLIVQFADAGGFNQVWDDRASLTYN